jgi:NADH:ubiquinone oxidoreductase subunit E
MFAIDVPRPAEQGVSPVAQEHASGDKRFKMLEATMKKHQFQQSALIEVLHAAQELFGYLEFDLLYFIARGLKLPPSRVYGVATFYHFFSLKPKGEHTCVVCTGTACYVKGAWRLLDGVEHEAHLAEAGSRRCRPAAPRAAAFLPSTSTPPPIMSRWPGSARSWGPAESMP